MTYIIKQRDNQNDSWCYTSTLNSWAKTLSRNPSFYRVDESTIFEVRKPSGGNKTIPHGIYKLDAIEKKFIKIEGMALTLDDTIQGFTYM